MTKKDKDTIYIDPPGHRYADMVDALKYSMGVTSALRGEPITTGDNELDAFLRKCMNTMKTKGADYTQGSGDPLHNFRTAADFLGRTMPEVWSVYFYKHYSRICKWVKTGGVASESVEDSIQDCIVYLLRLLQMVREQAAKAAPK